jgi:Coenzyme PQQ synthesis protein D (PqqD)
MPSRSYRVNAPLIATEKLDNEVMIVNLGKGNYYSLTGTGAVIWDLIALGRTESSILSEIVDNYVGDAEVIRQSLDRFVSELCDEDLIVASEVASASPSDAPQQAAIADRPAFAAPQLEKYTDMQELLLIDPIHEVNDDQGWPKMKA